MQYSDDVYPIGGDQKMHFDDINLDKDYTPSGAYGRSKLANILFTMELAKRLNGKFRQFGNHVTTERGLQKCISRTENIPNRFII